MADERLTEESVMGAAEAATGLSDWGSDSTFRIGLRRFLGEVSESDLESARDAAYSMTVNLLSQRLGMVADEKADPALLDIPIKRPLIIIGMPRTGSTILYDLLAADPTARSPRYWEGSNLWPAPELQTWRTDPRIAQAQAQLDAMLAVSPEIADMLPVGATLPFECQALMMHHFAGTQFGAFFDVPRFEKWVATEVIPGLYRSHRRALQQLTWKGPRGRWVLKSPIHLYDLDGLLDEYPDACLVWTHRDPMRVFASLVNLLFSAQRSTGLTPDRKALGRHIFDVYGALLTQGMASRSTAVIDDRILDISFRDVAKEPIRTVAHIHDHFDIDYTPQHQRLMADFIAAHPRADNAQQPEDCGFTEDQFRNTFADYYSRFGHLL